MVLPPGLLARLDDLIELGRKMPPGSERYYADHASLLSWRAASIAWLTRVLGADDAYTKEFASVSDSYYLTAASTGVAVLGHVRTDLAGGYLDRISDLIAASVIGDVWAQATELLEGGYAQAAATLAGSALEVGLRRAAEKNDVDVARVRGIGPLNEALARAGVYNALRQGQVDVWRQIRNAAAHGDTASLNVGDVGTMLQGAQSLLVDLLG